jgi:hypothetical protein
VPNPPGVQPNSKVSVTSPMTSAVTGPFPFSSTSQTVVAAFIDQNSALNVGYWAAGSMTWTARVTPTGGGSPIAIAGDPDIASWAPGRVDVFLADTSGRFWDCTLSGAQLTGTTTGNLACASWGSPSAGRFNGSPGVAAMGDGRLLVAGPEGAANATGYGYVAMWNNGFNTGGWVNGFGAFVAGSSQDVASW